MAVCGHLHMCLFQDLADQASGDGVGLGDLDMPRGENALFDHAFAVAEIYPRVNDEDRVFRARN